MRSNALIASAVTAVAVLTGGVGTLGPAHADTSSVAANPATPASHNVTVSPGDTLSKLADSNGTTYVRLYDANTTINDPNLIFPGENLRIPAADEQLPDRPLPGQVSAAPVAAETSAPAVVAPKPTVKPAAAVVSSSDGSVWDRLAQCESGGNWAADTGNGYFGGLQFTLSSWRAAGGTGYPNQASREEQIARAQTLESRQGWGAWPVCSRKVGIVD